MKLSLSVSTLSGIGKFQSMRLRELGISTLLDLIWHFPVRYEDMRNLLSISAITPGISGTITAEVRNVRSRKTRAGGLVIEAIVRDADGECLLIWFGNKFIAEQLTLGKQFRFSGTIADDWPQNAAMKNPAFEPIDRPSVQTGRMLPVYPLTDGITIKMMRRYVANALQIIRSEKLCEPIPERIMTARGFPEITDALRMMHAPQTPEEVARARARFAFEELYLLQLASAERRDGRRMFRAPMVPFAAETIKNFVARLPFTLTTAQRRASWQILQDLEHEQPMHRLLNGDVGSGKTIVAALAALSVAKSNGQTALLAPTEILARQHFATFGQIFLNEPSVRLALVTSTARELLTQGTVESVKKKELEALLRENFISCVIGTHVLLEDWVRLPALALAIVDEQHRFGVRQREELARRRGDQITPHFLSMTATPIPRTLALTAYGDLSISVLDEMPPGRAPITTRVLARESGFVALGTALARGERCYFVCPLIDPSDALGVRSIQETHAILEARFKKHVFLGLHGKMTSEEKQSTMEKLKNGEVQCVVSTTVVEVGVDVPEATFVFIEGAERFGLAQLHQLRGRVGRGVKAGACFLIPTYAHQKHTRLKFLEHETSGFKIAEYDLRLRGAGEIFGTTQSGVPAFKIADPFDTALVEVAREEAVRTIANREINSALREMLSARFSSQSA